MDSLKKDLRHRSMWREEGRYYGETAPTYWYIPVSFELVDTDDGPALVWSPPPLSSDPQRFYDMDHVRSDVGGMLNAFLGLPKGRTEAVMRFARRHGVLSLCRHGFAEGHQMPGPGNADGNIEWCGNLTVEPIAKWIDLAHRFRSLAAIAADLHRGGRGRPEDWARLPTWYGRPRTDFPGSKDVDECQREFTAELRNVIGQAGLRWEFEWTEAGPKMDLIRSEMPGFSIYWILVRELVFLVSRTEGIVFCGNPECGLPLLSPKRRPTATRRAYCQSCRDGNAKSRLGQRKRRAKLKEGSA